MTDDSGTGTADEPDTAGPGADPAPGPRPGPADSGAAAAPLPRPPRGRRRWLRWTAAGTSVLVLAAAGAGWAFYEKLEGNIRTDDDTARELKRYAADRPAPVAGGAQNVLLLGSDTRSGSNDRYGDDQAGQRSDTAILLHLSADRRNATAISIPRDLMAHIPSCAKTKGAEETEAAKADGTDGKTGTGTGTGTGTEGERTEAQFAQFNWAFQFGGAACTIRTVERMTGIRVDHHLILDFSGFKQLVDAVGGVDVCLPDAVRDAQAKLDLPAGRQTLRGEDALGYVRARHGIGNGSDTQRIDRQQQFLGSLVKKMRSNGVLLNPGKLYPVLDAATSALTADSGLDSLSELYALVRGVRNIPEDNVRFLTVPRQPYARDINRDELVEPAADRLFEQLRNDTPVQVGSRPGDRRTSGAGDAAGGGGWDIGDAGPRHSEPSRNAHPSPSGPGTDRMREARDAPSDDEPPTYPGTTAARDICATERAGNGVN